MQRWSFYQLRNFVEYRCVRDGVPLGLVDAAYTSRTCRCCGCREKANRNQAKFCCVQCGYTSHADVNAAQNISVAVVKQPIVGTFASHLQAPAL